MIYKWFGLAETEIAQLNDDKFYEQAAKAFYLQESEADNIKLGVLKAVGEIFKEG